MITRPANPRRRQLQAHIVSMAVAGAVIAACTGSGTLATLGASPSPSGGAPLRVVATTTVFADLAKRVGGDRATVDSLVPAGRDVHTFDPKPSDARKLANADVLLLNGLGLDDWIEARLGDVANANLRHVVLAKDLPGVQYIEGEGGGPSNPHLWLDVAFARLYVKRLDQEFSAARPADAPVFHANAAAYDRRLAELDASVRAAIGGIPAKNRKIVFQHDAFPYFARAYGMEVVDVIVESPGQEPSPRKIAEVVDTIRRSGAKAIVTEDQFNPTLAERIATEAGADVIEDLFTDALGPNPVDSYEGMIRWDVERIVAALK